MMSIESNTKRASAVNASRIRVAVAGVMFASLTGLIAAQANGQPIASNANAHHTWHVSASAAPGGDGSAGSPLGSLAAVEQVSAPGDTIIVDPSPSSVPPLDGGIALKPGQRLIGGGPPVVRLGQPLVQGGPPVVGPSNLSALPAIANTSRATNSGDAVELADRTDVENIVVATAYRGGIYGRDVVDVSAEGNDIAQFNASGTAGFVVQPFYLNSYTPGLARFVSAGIPAGWAGIMVDSATVGTHVLIEGNYVHDGVCGDGIDLRSKGTADVTAQVNRNFVTRLFQCSSTSVPGSSVRTIEGIGTQVTGTGILDATLDGNTEANTGSPGANMDSLFVNPAESGTLIEQVKHNLYTSGIGGASTNGLEFRKLPLSVDSDSWTFLAGLSVPGRSHEEVAVHRIADRCDPEGGRSRRYGGAVDAEARHQRRDVLPLEVEIRRRRRVGT